MKNIFFIRAGAALAALAIFACVGPVNASGDKPLKVLSTTFPVHMIVRNVMEGSGLEPELLLPSQMGCPHDYALTPKDMMKIAESDILVINGSGMEDFIFSLFDKSKARVVIIDATSDIKNKIYYTAETEKSLGAEESTHHSPPRDAVIKKGGQPRENPHLFTSPRMAAKMTLNIGEGLAKADPDHASLYLKNAKAYSDRLTALSAEMTNAVKKFGALRVVLPEEVFDYLARDLEMNAVARIKSHSEQASASEMLDVIRRVRRFNPDIIITEMQNNDKTAETISNETGIPIVQLDPCDSGPEDAPLDYYENVMRQNIAAIQKTLAGGR